MTLEDFLFALSVVFISKTQVKDSHVKSFTYTAFFYDILLGRSHAIILSQANLT